MKTNIWNITKNISAVIGVLAVIFGVSYKAIEIYNDINSRGFTTVESKIDAETFHGRIPSNKLERYYMLDSLEKLETKKFRKFTEQSIKQMDSLIRLGVYITNKASKKTDTLNRQLEHTLEHVDQ